MSLIPTNADRTGLMTQIDALSQNLKTLTENLHTLQTEMATQLEAMLTTYHATNTDMSPNWQHIISAALACGISAENIAVQSGVSISAVQRWSQGTSTPQNVGCDYITIHALLPLLQERMQK